jgi:hypothetical protein
VLSHWDRLHENLQESPQAFYQGVEEALQRREIPNAKISRVEHKEGGVLSAQRLYLRVEREQLVFDICGAPFGTGFFTSWWLAEPKMDLNPILKLFIMFGFFIVFAMSAVIGLVIGPMLLLIGVGFGLVAISNTGGDAERFVLALPLFGWFYRTFIKPETYYRLDSALMFQSAVHNAVLEMIDAMTTTKGLRALSENERKPIMRDFFTRGR